LFYLQALTPYEKKKYVWKMLYIYMLGYDVDFGHMEAVSLISAPKYPEKQVNYFPLMYLFIVIDWCIVCLILVNF
jgi:hypothetical protein